MEEMMPVFGAGLSLPARAGTRVSETTIAATMAEEMVNIISWNSSPTILTSSIKGRMATRLVDVEAKMAPATSLTAFSGSEFIC